MSCGAFSLHIEHWCLQELFERLAADQATFDFPITKRNSPLREFLANMLG
jgi:hypothetical protein